MISRIREHGRRISSVGASPAPVVSGPATKVILYLEEIDDDSVLLRHALRSAGLPCRLEVITTATAGRAFLAAYPLKAPDLIICDLGLAGSCGLDFVDWVRKQPHLKHVPVVLVTGSLPPVQRERASLLAVDACIEKSVDWHELTRQVQRLLHPRP